MSAGVATTEHARHGTPDEPVARSGRLVTPAARLAAAITAGALLLAGWLFPLAAGPGSGRPFLWASLAIGLVYGGRAALLAVAGGAFNIDVLMVLGAVFAAWLGAPGEGALLLVLFVLSGALEGLASRRTSRAVEALSRLMPTGALRWTGAGWDQVPPESLAAGDRIRVLPGERIPTDAVVLDGISAIDQAALTGEPVPRDVAPGDELYAGTINAANPIEARVLRPPAQSSLQRILDLVIEAQAQREPIQRFIDRASQPYALSVTGVSLAVLLAWRFGFGDPWPDAVRAAITLLIVASPCALVIATPTATLAAITRGARAGVLFKGGAALDRLARVRAVAFDKTGTLTVGRPRVTQVHPVAWSEGHDLLAVAAALEASSTHPIAAAIVEAARARDVSPAPATGITAHAGEGIAAHVRGTEARIGKYAFVEPITPTCLRARLRELLAHAQSRGDLATVVAYDDQAALITLADAARPGAAELAPRLHALGVRPVVMLTGDARATAARVAGELALDAFHAELLPRDKVDHVRSLRAAHGRLGVIGDGVNDAPALAASDVAIAIGSIGSDAALESADVVLLADDLRTIPWAVGLARRARRTVGVNLVFAGVAIVVMGVATIVGSRTGHRLPLWAGVLGHEGGTLLVVLNSLLLLATPSVRRGDAAGRPRPAPAAGTDHPGAAHGYPDAATHAR